MISAVITVTDEYLVLKRCLDSLKNWVDEIVLVSLSKSSQLRDMAKNYPAVIYEHPRVSYVEKVRTFGISKAAGDWIIVLDPDEEIPATLATKLRSINGQQFSAVNIPRKNIFFGRWISHSNFWPDRQIRFFQKGRLVWPEQIHAYPNVTGLVLDLPAREELAINHYGYVSFSEFFSRQNRYSTIRATELHAQGKKFLPFDFIWQPVREFLARYVKHLGFLDGYTGLFLVIGLMIYQLSVQIKLWQKSSHSF